MTVSSDIARADYNGTGAVVPYPVPFRFLENSHLRVLRTVISTNATTTLILDSIGADGFSVVGAGQPSGGTVSVVTPIAVGERLSILRNVPRTQLTDYIPNDPFPAESHERALDKLTMIVQQDGEVIGRAVVLSPQTTGVSNELPGPQALYLLRWKADLSGLENVLPPAIATLSDGAVTDAKVSPIAGIQTSKLAFPQTGTGAVVRSVYEKLLDDAVTPEEFGAGGDGVTDDYTAISRALTAAAASRSRTLHLTKAVYATGTGLIVPTGVRIVGRGNGFSAWNGYAASTGSTIKWIGGTGGGTVVVLFQFHNRGGGGMENVTIDADNKADYALFNNGSTGLLFQNVSCFNGLTADYKLDATLNIGVGNTATTCSWNTHIGMFIGSASALGSSCLILAGDNAAGNACHNTFINTTINHGGARHALGLGNCDNNTFIDTYINRAPGGTGYGVECVPDTVFPSGNTFYHLQAGDGGWHQPVTQIVAPAIIHDYQLDNGQPYPIINGTTLHYSTSFGLMTSDLPRTVGAVGEPSFQNSWVNYGAPIQTVQFWRDRLGFVHLRGAAKNGTLTTAIFTLPAGYRPTTDEYFVVNSNGIFGYLFITAAGAVTAQAGNNALFSLSGVTFRADYPQS